jgi:uncharacterized membrane protein
MKETKKLVLGALLISIAMVLGFTGWGFFPLPLPIQGATIFHIPVILAGIMLGPWYGFITGCVFGAFAIQQFPMFPWFVLFPARPLIGVVAGLVFILINFWDKSKVISAGIAGIMGSLTNSIITMGLGVLFRVFGPALDTNLAVVYSIIPVILIEAVLAAILVPIVFAGWKMSQSNSKQA